MAELKLPTWLRKKRPEQLDPHELMAARLGHNGLLGDPIPPLGNRLNSKQLLVGFVLLVLVVGAVRAGTGAAPKLTKSCTTVAFAFGTDDVKRYHLVHWSATGPADAHLVIGLDTTTLPTSFQRGRVTGPTPIKGCQVHGVFGVSAPVGSHVLRVFSIAADGTVTTVGQQPLTIEDP